MQLLPEPTPTISQVATMNEVEAAELLQYVEDFLRREVTDPRADADGEHSDSLFERCTLITGKVMTAMIIGLLCEYMRMCDSGDESVEDILTTQALVEVAHELIEHGHFSGEPIEFWIEASGFQAARDAMNVLFSITEAQRMLMPVFETFVEAMVEAGVAVRPEEDDIDDATCVIEESETK